MYKRQHKDDPRIADVVADMANELGMEGNQYPDLLPRMAQFELTLLDWAEQNKGARKYVAFADKCWPAFPSEFGFEPCYVNSRLASRGIPVACEVDIYGALSEYIGACITGDAVTLLDINNSVPRDLYEEDIKGKYDYTLKDTFMGFHCGNTPFCKLAKGAAVKYQLIQNRLLENGGEPDFTRGTLEGDIAAGQITFFRLQSAADGTLHSYIAQGEVLPVATRSFGGIGIFAIPEMGRFYRHVLIEKNYPHHGAVALDVYKRQMYIYESACARIKAFVFNGKGKYEMNRKELVTRVSEKTGLMKKDVEAVTDAVLDEIRDCLLYTSQFACAVRMRRLRSTAKTGIRLCSWVWNGSGTRCMAFCCAACGLRFRRTVFRTNGPRVISRGQAKPP